jgi:hypothetical protein
MSAGLEWRGEDRGAIGGDGDVASAHENILP